MRVIYEHALSQVLHIDCVRRDADDSLHTVYSRIVLVFTLLCARVNIVIRSVYARLSTPYVRFKMLAYVRTVPSNAMAALSIPNCYTYILHSIKHETNTAFLSFVRTITRRVRATMPRKVTTYLFLPPSPPPVLHSPACTHNVSCKRAREIFIEKESARVRSFGRRRVDTTRI